MTSSPRNRQRRVWWGTLAAAALLALAAANAFAAECKKCQSQAPDWPNLLSGAGRQAAMALPASHPLHINPTLQDIADAKDRQVVNPKAAYERWRAHNAALPNNVRANDPTGDQGPPAAETQSETAIVAQGNNVVVAWNDSKGLRLGTPTTITSYAYSTNGGLTFTDGGNVPLIAAGDQVFGDCTLDVDAAGNYYLCSIYVSNSVPTGQHVCVHRGTFTGPVLTWGTPSLALIASAGPPAQAMDKNYMTCDKANGNLYVTATRFGGPTAIIVTCGTALGTSWTAPVVLDTSAGIQGSRPIVGPEGNLYVCWQSGWGSIFCDLSSANGQISFRRCTAPTLPVMVFDPIISAGTVQMNWTSYWAGNLRANALFFPDMAVDRSGGPNNGNVYVTWNESTPWAAPVASGVSTAETESNNNANDANVKTISPGDNATGTMTPTTDLDYWRISATAGQHIMLRLEPQGFNCGVSGTSRNFRLRLYKGNTPTAGDSILGNSNLNGFASEIVFDAPETASYFIRVQDLGASTGTYVLKSRLLTYGVPSPGRDMRDVVVARSIDKGVSFQPEVLVNNDAANLDNCIPAITVDGCGKVHAFWYDNRDEAASAVLRSYYRGISADGGLTWLNQRVSNELMYFNLNTVAVPNYGEYNQAYGDGPRVYTVWSDERLTNANTSGVDTYVAVLGGCETVPVEVADLAVSASDRGVSLSWRLSDPRELLGVRVQRGDEAEGPFVDRSQDLTPSRSMSFDDPTVEAGHTYYYRLVLASTSGKVDLAGPIRVTVSDLASLRTALATPVVSAGSVEIRFSIGRSRGPARLDVFDVSGHRVRSLAQGALQPGQYLRSWDRRDDNGTQVSRGVYMIRLQAGDSHDSKKLVLVRE